VQVHFRNQESAFARVVWLVALVSSIESMAQAISSFLDEAWPEVVIWICAMLAIGCLAAWAETVKRTVGD
jgi:hypothetical protein